MTTKALKLFRKRQALSEGINPNKVFTKTVLNSLLQRKPTDVISLKRVPGVGKVTIQKYGDEILKIFQTPETSEEFDESRFPDSLSPEQLDILRRVYKGENVFMSGPGGTGKSFVIECIIQLVEARGDDIQVCAMTGSASELLKCSSKTLHSWSKTGIMKGDPERIIALTSTLKTAITNFRDVDVLVIDEVSMMSSKAFHIINRIAQKVRKNDKPFGGIQMIVSGDFFQIPPVETQGDPDTGKFCFESEMWFPTFPKENFVSLTKIFRQSDKRWIKSLGQIRRGQSSTKTREMLTQRICEPPEGVDPIRITPSRAKCREINDREMMSLNTPSETFQMEVCYDKMPMSTSFPPYVENEVKTLKKSLLLETLTLREGARVMCIANLEMIGNRYIVNGSQGTVLRFDIEGYPVVRFENGRTKTMKPYTIKSETIDGLSIRQVPLILSWAITTHKSQGITVDRAIIDAGSDNFEYGQIYVALSRVKSLEGLFLTGFDPQKIRANPIVKAFYESLS